LRFSHGDCFDYSLLRFILLNNICILAKKSRRRDRLIREATENELQPDKHGQGRRVSLSGLRKLHIHSLKEMKNFLSNDECVPPETMGLLLYLGPQKALMS
jgi:hypothetical protein